MNETLYLAITILKELVPQNIIIAMATMLFVVTCTSIALLEISLIMFVGNIASLIDRILPVEKTPKIVIGVESSDKQQWLKKLMFWKKPL